ncbi:GNAT family N-acetyltransferase [Shewanella fidelis]|uniref:GNAT family N-acetyltransferase n=1 Tax=Shewanella fidelis TaxID=173509 RepID=A0AAW8NK88_9GAMM|nr:GNAT family N-acetyltransferase [Shewanella fidelis]MDR8523107.1 GNAT family N-acetyltransferase [Shewanella fidelis]MDW4811567.1 GNAT family N-acetyltransferase [Shewanella fidelis]MDW4815688.1 GNAT family N-acetyltransferase [Shewanella fidelis]MDW4819778.1 GNAT family N-acetyltransferase [Shewanella fidelis]MDW4824248.1 GNAT family N-acetyltransferase [Shewanella fidelis]
MNIEIREAQLCDAKSISELIVPLVKKYVCPDCDASVHDVLLGSMSEQRIESYLSSNYCYFVAVSQNKKVIGVAGIRDNSHLYHLFVHDNFQGLGLSRKLWQAAKQQAIQKGNQGRFTVNSALGAETVYLNFGFKRIAGIRREKGMVDIPMLLEA